VVTEASERVIDAPGREDEVEMLHPPSPERLTSQRPSLSRE
jgi:hypothetical protein